jgi:hypothetical protein
LGVKVVCAGVVFVFSFSFSFSFPLSFLNFEDDNGVEDSTCFGFSVSTTTTSCFIFSFELAAGPGFADVCGFEDFREVES